MVFDLLRLYGVDLTARSWTDRRATLERLELTGPHWQVPPTFTDGDALWQATRERGLEGTVSKRRTSRYAAGARTEDWLKVPHRTSQSVVIGGWRPETDQVDRLGAVLPSLQMRVTDAVPADDALGTTWVHPVLVCDVHALGLTNSRRLRQPAYRGLRPDLTPGDIDPGELPDA